MTGEVHVNENLTAAQWTANKFKFKNFVCIDNAYSSIAGGRPDGRILWSNENVFQILNYLFINTFNDLENI